jgi:uncharacterized protein YndB with AHSA1/START domain
VAERASDKVEKRSEFMSKPIPLKTIALMFALAPGLACAENVLVPAPLGSAATTVYRQVMPDGRIVYTDKAPKDGKVDQTITVEPPAKGKVWTSESGTRPVAAPQVEHKPVNRVNAIPGAGKQKTLDEAASDVIRAEMLVEDAKRRQKEGVEPLPGERTANSGGGSRLNDAYQARQQALAAEVAQAEAALKRATTARDALK